MHRKGRWDNDEALEGAAIAVAPTLEKSPRFSTYGTIQCGYETMVAAWPRLHHKWSLGGGREPLSSSYTPPKKLEADWLMTHPVDLLVIDQGGLTAEALAARSKDHWERVVSDARPSLRPRVILESWPAASLGWLSSPTGRSKQTRWRDIGYLAPTDVQSPDPLGAPQFLPQNGPASPQRKLPVGSPRPDARSSGGVDSVP